MKYSTYSCRAGAISQPTPVYLQLLTPRHHPLLLLCCSVMFETIIVSQEKRWFQNDFNDFFVVSRQFICIGLFVFICSFAATTDKTFSFKKTFYFCNQFNPILWTIFWFLDGLFVYLFVFCLFICLFAAMRDKTLKKVKVAHTQLPNVGFRCWSQFLAVSLQVTSHKPGGRLPLLSARPTVTLTTLKRAATSFAA